MSEEIKKAYKLFNREDLIDDGYERDLDSNIQVFLTTKEMINYMDLQQKVEQLENIRKEAIKATKDVKQFVYDELVDRNVSGATETHCKIMDLLNILNKGDNNGK